MANHYPFYIVDVFAEQRYNGNQLLVLRGNPSAEMMQVIAKEIGFSETTFVTSDETQDGGYNVRIFTTASELPFAGHPTLGTAYIIRRAIIQEAVEQIVLNLEVGPITVTFSDDDLVWMRQNPAVFGHEYASTAMADVLGLKREDVDDQFPVEEVSTGMPFIIVPLKTLAAVQRAKVRLDKFRGMIEGVRGLHADAILVFCPETYHEDNQLNVRVFVDFHGAPEDAATGSANGCLAAYLAYHEYFGSPEVDIRVEQGYEIERPSLLYLRSAHMDGESIANVGGKVIVNARGEWTSNES
jgi:trans-2,3-dihydro-3-hydroxyanthranilate isomerase